MKKSLLTICAICLIGSQSAMALNESYMVIVAGKSRFAGYTQSDLTEQFTQVFEKSENKFSKNDVFENRKQCEKYYKRQTKFIRKQAGSYFFKETDKGNYPHSANVFWAPAFRNLGLIRLNGCPDDSEISQDFELAAEFLTKAAESYDERAMYQLGLMYLDGLGVREDTVKGLELIENAAAEWSDEAAKYLQEMGEEVPGKNQYQTKIIIAYETRSDNL